MGKTALLICRSQTEALGVRRHLSLMGIPAEVTRPPRHQRTESCGWAVRVGASMAEDAVHRLRKLGVAPCRVVQEEDDR